LFKKKFESKRAHLLVINLLLLC